MKVVAEKIFYEMDLYQYPDENTSYGLFGLGGGFIKNAPRRKEPELVHKKGDFKEWKFEVKEHCCELMKGIIGREQVTFQGPIYFEHRDRNSEEKIRFLIESIGAFIACSCWSIQLIRIEFCPFCGEKIEIEEEKNGKNTNQSNKNNI